MELFDFGIKFFFWVWKIFQQFRCRRQFPFLGSFLVPPGRLLRREPLGLPRLVGDDGPSVDILVVLSSVSNGFAEGFVPKAKSNSSLRRKSFRSVPVPASIISFHFFFKLLYLFKAWVLEILVLNVLQSSSEISCHNVLWFLVFKKRSWRSCRKCTNMSSSFSFHTCKQPVDSEEEVESVSAVSDWLVVGGAGGGSVSYCGGGFWCSISIFTITSFKPGSKNTRISTFHNKHLLKFSQSYSSGYSFTYKKLKLYMYP